MCAHVHQQKYRAHLFRRGGLPGVHTPPEATRVLVTQVHITQRSTLTNVLRTQPRRGPNFPTTTATKRRRTSRQRCTAGGSWNFPCCLARLLIVVKRATVLFVVMGHPTTGFQPRLHWITVFGHRHLVAPPGLARRFVLVIVPLCVFVN